MGPERWQRVKELFHGAQSLPVEKRAEFLASLPGNDASLRSEIASLLSAQRHGDAALEPPGPTGSSGADVLLPDDAMIGRQIGPFLVVRLLGHGGMGSVYEGRQTEPRRSVALKVIRGGGRVDQLVIKLFRREVQALALLTHPHIAGLYEAGHTDDGRHFFAMELVEGAPLTEHGRGKKLTTERKLDLFALVCDAIAYAHQRGVIHRDIKPSNILVDTAGRPKILDFGLAKITESDVTLTTMTQDTGRIQGTLAYMSPEQARGKSDEIDIRSDIYSLGVVLYELLTDQLPYDIRTAPLPHAVRLICDEAPKRPSAATRALRGDLETILLKALEKEPSCRYQSATELAADIRRFRAGQPIVARPPSAVYLLRKLMRRHRLGVAAAGAFGVVLLASSIVAWVLSVRAERSAAEARRAQARAESATNFLADALESSDPSVSQGRDLKVRELLDRAAKKADQSLRTEPALASNIRSVIGRSYMGLGMYDEAMSHLQAALDLRRKADPGDLISIANGLFDIGMLLLKRENAVAADQPLREALALQQKALGSEGPEVARTLHALGTQLWLRRSPEAEKNLETTLAMRRRVMGPDHFEVAETLALLALVREQEGRFEDARAQREEACRIYRQALGDQPATAAALTGLAGNYRRLGRLEAAEAKFREALAIGRKVYPAGHPELASHCNNFAGLLTLMKKPNEAGPLYREALETYRRVFGARHAKVAMALSNLGACYLSEDHAADAEPLYREAAEIYRERSGASWTTGVALLGHGKSLRKQNRVQDAEPILHEASTMLNKSPKQAEAWRLCDAELEIAACLVSRGEFALAEPHLLKGHELSSRIERLDKKTDAPMLALVELYDVWNKPDQAAEWRAKLASWQVTTPPAASQASRTQPESKQVAGRSRP